MGGEIGVLIVSAVSIAFLHTVLGPDHYIPFVVMAKSRQWSLTKTIWVTGICGLGHVLSSVILGIIGISIGLAVSRIESIESFRGGIAAYLLIAFGLIYLVYGIRRAVKYKKHTHKHLHTDGTYHNHEHTHTSEHSHIHIKE
ncbi:MAG: hypothetical protein ACLFUW_10745, partial [Bacteroidales bacterium]